VKEYEVKVVFKDKQRPGVEITAEREMLLYVKAKDVFSAKTKAFGAIEMLVAEVVDGQDKK